ncbi:hypothetical protein VTL71DRAFT_15539 [Oculimacula yallundae]|uniref:Uncharacterized protein n=1 Tax=Oculimacula yallundae TaxID=86028 RepID=A0ABR4CI80_9HELO
MSHTTSLFDAEVHRSKYASVSKVHVGQLDYQPERKAVWSIDWRAPLKMIGLLSLGVAVAVGHHFFYRHLHLKEVSTDNSRWNFNSQSWAIRYGTAFAFLAKTFLAACISVAYQQHIWTTMRSKRITISGLDATFGATKDIFAFLNPTFLLNVKVGAVLAALTWLMPLSAIVTPATLSVIPSTKMTPRVSNVPLVDFNNTSAIYNKEGNLLNTDINTADNGVTPFLTRLLAGTASGSAILPSLAVAPAANYSLQFFAPSFQCNIASPNITAEIQAVLRGKRNIGPEPDKIPFVAYTPQVSMLAARHTNVSSADYTYYSEFFEGCVTTSASMAKPNNTYFYCDGMAYFMEKGDSAGEPFAGAYLRMKANADFWSCAVRDTFFNITFNATGSLQTINHPYNFEYHNKALNPSHYVHGQVVSNFLTGVLFGFLGSVASYRTQIKETALFGAFKTLPVPEDPDEYEFMGPISYKAIPDADKALARNLTMGQLIEELSRNLTLSFFSSERLHIPGGITTTVNIGSTPNIYNYNPTNLFLAYGLAIVVTILSVTVGMRAIVVNGVSHETSFSSILCSTRNETLDNLTAGFSLAAEPLGSNVRGTKLRFGLLRSNEHGLRRAGFGIDGEVDDLRKGTPCY